MTQLAERSPSRTRQILIVGYGAVAYLLFLGVFAYTIGFLANFGVPKGVDDGPEGSAVVAVIVNAALLGLFAVQHSIMARPGSRSTFAIDHFDLFGLRQVVARAPALGGTTAPDSGSRCCTAWSATHSWWAS